jgi:hypothetical protein
MTCDYSQLDGAYLLGALAPGERQEFERHLRECAVCTRAVGELAGLPGLLARVGPEDLVNPADEAVPESLLPALVHEARRSQRRQGILIAVLSAAAVTIVATILVATGIVGGGDDSPTAAPVASSSTVAAAGRDMETLGGAPVRANLDLVSVDWGTRIDLACTYEPTDDTAPARRWTYVMIVHTRNGASEQVATWRALPGRTMRLTAATAAGRSDLAWVEVRTADGRPVLKLTV